MKKYLTLTALILTLGTASCKKKDKPREYRVASVVLDKQELRMGTEDSATLICTVKPEEAQNKQVQWSSSNPSIASVDQNGKIISFATRGRTTISVVSVDDSRRRDTCVVIVSDDVNSVRIAPDSVRLLVGSGEVQLSATVLPAKATNKNVSWRSTNTAIATVTTDGRVRGVARGNAAIVVTTAEGNFTDTCRVIVDTTVPFRVTSVTLNKTTLSLDIGATETLVPTISPANASIKTVSWSSSNTTVATVNGSGLVTAVAPGNAVITVTTSDGNRTATCSVTVRTLPVTGVTLNRNDLGLTINETETLIATVLPAAANQNVSWSSNNTSVATVNASTGQITARTRGTAVITATTAEGNRTATCTITVRDLYVLTTTQIFKNGTAIATLENASSYTIDGSGMYKIGNDIFVTGFTTATSGSARITTRIWKNGAVFATVPNAYFYDMCASPSGHEFYAVGQHYTSGTTNYRGSMFWISPSGEYLGYSEVTTATSTTVTGVTSPTNGMIYISGYDANRGWVKRYEQREGGGIFDVWEGGNNTLLSGLHVSGSNWQATGRSGGRAHLFRNGTAIPLSTATSYATCFAVASNGDVYIGGSTDGSMIWRVSGTTVTTLGNITSPSVVDIQVLGNDVYAVGAGGLFKNNRLMTGYSNVRAVIVE